MVSCVSLYPISGLQAHLKVCKTGLPVNTHVSTKTYVTGNNCNLHKALGVCLYYIIRTVSGGGLEEYTEAWNAAVDLVDEIVENFNNLMWTRQNKLTHVWRERNVCDIWEIVNVCHVFRFCLMFSFVITFSDVLLFIIFRRCRDNSQSHNLRETLVALWQPTLLTTIPVSPTHVQTSLGHVVIVGLYCISGRST